MECATLCCACVREDPLFFRHRTTEERGGTPNIQCLEGMSRSGYIYYLEFVYDSGNVGSQLDQDGGGDRSVHALLCCLVHRQQRRGAAGRARYDVVLLAGGGGVEVARWRRPIPMGLVRVVGRAAEGSVGHRFLPASPPAQLARVDDLAHATHVDSTARSGEQNSARF